LGIFAAYLFTIGWINAFNFMDGINGITAVYTLVSLGTFIWLNQIFEFVSQQLLIFLMLSVLLFSFFNLRKRAVTFAGDVGSIPLAFLLAWFMISLMNKTGQLQYILFFALYGIDSVITILYRLGQRENIFEAHRSHLYQLLSNELNCSHVQISLLYGFLQAVLNMLTIVLISVGKMTWPLFILILFVLSIGYFVVREKALRTIHRKASVKY
jgi:UDP-N-acetylmuramyl pentapeptide phosphotransferase/UDP-N-acetylglucosamine-1-phosphate transferase